jgi:hypothetical protein
VLSAVLLGVLDGFRITRLAAYPDCLLSTEDSCTAREVSGPEDEGICIEASSPWRVWWEGGQSGLRIVPGEEHLRRERTETGLVCQWERPGGPGAGSRAERGTCITRATLRQDFVSWSSAVTRAW